MASKAVGRLFAAAAAGIITETDGQSSIGSVSQPDTRTSGIAFNVSAVQRALQFMRGAVLAGLLPVAALAVGLLTGLVADASILIYPAAALGATALVLIPDRERAPQILGILAFGGLALFVAMAGGLGGLEVCAIVGSVAALALLGVEVPAKLRVPIGAIAAIILMLVVVNLVPLVLDGGGLNHDESAYALKARHWIEGTPETGWSVHRGVAMSAYGFLVFEAGGDEGALRLLGLAAIVGFVAATWVLGNRVGGKWVGPLSAIALVSSPVLLRRSTEYLSDVPSSALLMAAMIIVWRQFGEREKPGYGLLWLLPFAWAAFYLRYQSVLTFSLIAIAIGVLFREKVKVGWQPIALTAGVGLIGLIPHFVFATSEEGSPLGIILFTADVAGREYWGQGLVDYFLLMGWPLAAFIGPAAVVFFVWWLIREWDSVTERTRCLFLMIPAAGQVLLLGIVSHGEARFIFLPLALTLIGGITGFFVVRNGWRPGVSQAVSLGLVVLLVGSLGMAAAYVRRAVENRAVDTMPIEEAGEEIRRISGDAVCGVMTSYLPQITFYSECHTEAFRTHLEADEALSRVTGDELFMLMLEDGKRQPEGEDLADLLDLTVGDPVVIQGETQYVEIFDFVP
jgi:hypothetical protein